MGGNSEYCLSPLDRASITAQSCKMTSLWIPITIAAAFLQNIRSAMQKHLKTVMGTTSATFVRFGFGIPFACFYWLILHIGFEIPRPSLNSGFLFWVSIASVTQIGATFLLLHLFSFRNFAVGTAYSRTEPAQTALFAALVFGEFIPLSAILAISIAIVGLMIISVARTTLSARSILTSVFKPNALIGLASGTLFGIAAASYRAAAIRLEDAVFIMQAATTLCVAIIFQSIIMFIWIALRQPGELLKIRKAWKPSLIVGFFGATASFGWFTAFTLQSAALVKVLAQIEMIFTFAASAFVFRESISKLEILGCLLISTGIVVLILV